MCIFSVNVEISIRWIAWLIIGYLKLICLKATFPKVRIQAEQDPPLRAGICLVIVFTDRCLVSHSSALEEELGDRKPVFLLTVPVAFVTDSGSAGRPGTR